VGWKISHVSRRKFYHTFSLIINELCLKTGLEYHKNITLRRSTSSLEIAGLLPVVSGCLWFGSLPLRRFNCSSITPHHPIITPWVAMRSGSKFLVIDQDEPSGFMPQIVCLFVLS
jgi:hypothetical protein